MTKQVVRFISKKEIAVGVKFVKDKDVSVGFEVRSATDSTDTNGDVFFNLIDEDGDVVSSFDDALLLASGRIFQSENPIDIVRGDAVNYTMKLEPHTYFRNEFEALVTVIQNDIRVSGYNVLMGVDIEEYEYRLEQ